MPKTQTTVVTYPAPNTAQVDFSKVMGENFTFALDQAKQAGSDSFSLEFEGPSGPLVCMCLIRPRQIAEEAMEAIMVAREECIRNGGNADPLNSAEYKPETV